MPARGQCQRAVAARLLELGIDPDTNILAARALGAARRIDDPNTSGSGFAAADKQLHLIMYHLDPAGSPPPPTPGRSTSTEKSEPATEVDPVDELRSRVAKLRTDTG